MVYQDSLNLFNVERIRGAKRRGGVTLWSTAHTLLTKANLPALQILQLFGSPGSQGFRSLDS